MPEQPGEDGEGNIPDGGTASTEALEGRVPVLDSGSGPGEAD